MDADFAAEILVIRLAKTGIIQRSILTSFKRGWNIPDRQLQSKPSEENHTASGIASNKNKAMKAATD